MLPYDDAPTWSKFLRCLALPFVVIGVALYAIWLLIEDRLLTAIEYLDD